MDMRFVARFGLKDHGIPNAAHRTRPQVELAIGRGLVYLGCTIRGYVWIVVRAECESTMIGRAVPLVWLWQRDPSNGLLSP